ncbi:MAG TPA: serine/threonine-protein kinase [Pseudomonadota bacterium]|nr:serine/threonine-protein kinase [Pseudomonadota bacterium]
MLGELVGSYKIVRVLGEGGMGTVYEAVHQSLGRRAAIKVLRPEHSQNQELLQRFFNEARAVNIVQHPSLVNIYEFGTTPAGTAYIVMEFLAGESLRSRLSRLGGRMGLAAVPIARQVANALAATHQKQIVHRDLKPDNVMLVPDPELPEGERAKVLDFGIAKLSGDGGGEALKVKTKTGAMIGTPTYMSPEQCRGLGTIDGRTDVYSLGVILFELLGGRPPFVSDGLGELIGMHMFQPAPDLAPLAPKTPKDLLQLVRRMLAKNPAERPSMEETAATLTRIGRSVSQSALAMPALGAGPLEAGGPAPPVNTTIGQSTGQRLVGALQARRRTLGLLAGTGALILALGSGVLWPQLHSTHTKPSPTTLHIEPATPPAASSALPSAPPAADAIPAPTAVTASAGESRQKPADPAPGLADSTPLSAARSAKSTDSARCQAAFKRGRYVEAVAVCTAALKDDPDEPNVQRTLQAAQAAAAAGPKRRPQPGSSTSPPTENTQHRYEKVKPLD